MKARCDNFLNYYKLKLMTFLEITHCLIFLVLSLIKFIENNDFEFELYIFTINSILIIFMFYFSLHSVKKKNFVEFLSFLSMLIFSSYVMIYDFIIFVRREEVKAFNRRFG